MVSKKYLSLAILMLPVTLAFSQGIVLPPFYTWIGKTYVEDFGYEPYLCYLAGDSTIADKTYKKLYMINRRIYGNREPHYYGAYRVAESKMYCLYDGDSREFMWVDFDLQIGDTWTTPDLAYNPDLCIKVLYKETVIALSSIQFRYIIAALYNKRTKEIVSSAKCFVEGVGDIHNFCTRNTWEEDENNEFLLQTSVYDIEHTLRDFEKIINQAKSMGIEMKKPRQVLKHNRDD